MSATAAAAAAEPSARLLYSLDETAQLLSISVLKARRLAASGDLFTVHLGRRVLVPAEEVERYVEELKAKARAGQ